MTTTDNAEVIGNLVPFTAWRRQLGLSISTAHRYRKRGMIAVQNVFGKLYVTRDQITQFEERVEAGEFSKDRGRPLLAKNALSPVTTKRNDDADG